MNDAVPMAGAVAVDRAPSQERGGNPRSVSPGQLDTSPREDALRRFFRQLPPAPDTRPARTGAVLGVVAAGTGLFFWLFATNVVSQVVLGSVFLAVGTVVALRSLWRSARQRHVYETELRACFPRPDDRQIDAWLGDGIERLTRHSLERLGLTDQECAFVDLPPIVAPVTWLEPGTAPEDVVWQVGRDGQARFGVYAVAFLWLADERLGIFECRYNLLRDAVVNEGTRELFYGDIVSVSMRESSSALTLPSGQSLVGTQEVEIAVANGSFFTFTVGASELKRLTGAAIIPETGAERAVQALRKQLQDRRS